MRGNRIFALAVTLASVFTGSAAAQTVVAVLFASGLSRPNLVTTAPGDPDRFYVVEQPGTVQMIDRSGNALGTFLDISSVVSGGTSGETGLLGLAFAPDYATSGRFFVNYTRQITGQLTTVIEEFGLGLDGLGWFFDLGDGRRFSGRRNLRLFGATSDQYK